jgi:hypothetical protein
MAVVTHVSLHSSTTTLHHPTRSTNNNHGEPRQSASKVQILPTNS